MPQEVITIDYYITGSDVIGVHYIFLRKNYVKCQIAHYAYCGLMTHRTIVQEDLIIPLDGSVMVTVYPKEFNVFPPEKVVKRA
jgi:hypothetical protein